MKVGFIGLGNVGSKLAGSLLRNGVDVTIRDLDEAKVAEFAARGAKVGESPAPEDLQPSDLAAWTMLANMLMNLDEVVTK